MTHETKTYLFLVALSTYWAAVVAAFASYLDYLLRR